MKKGLLFILLIASIYNEDIFSVDINNLPFKPDECDLMFYLISDYGYNGYYFQNDVAEEMGVIADSLGWPDFIISCGDNFQVNGVASAYDPLWKNSFEDIYFHPGLLVDWYTVLGNHEYQGNTEAIFEYSKISRRWVTKERYYSFSKQLNDTVSAKFVFIDTSPFLKYYHTHIDKYPDINQQDTAKQKLWLKQSLEEIKEDWCFVFGHHPVYMGENDKLKNLSDIHSLLRDNGVDFYFSGHEHNFQHYKPQEENVDYIISGTGAKIFKVNENDNCLKCFAQPGFLLVAIKNKIMYLVFFNYKGESVYFYQKEVL